MQVTDYQKDKVAFNQSSCLICLQDYQEQDRIIQLTCQHIFHSNCFSESFLRCPVCHKEIVGRIDTFDVTEFEKEVDELFKKIYEIVPEFPFNKEHVSQYILNKRSTEVVQSFDARKIIRELDDSLNILLSNDPNEISHLVNHHFVYFKENEISYLNETRVNIHEEEQFLENRVNRIRFFSICTPLFAEKHKPLSDYLEGIAKKMEKDRDLQRIYKERETEYIKLSKEYLKQKSLFGKISHFYALTDTQRDLLKREPELTAGVRFVQIIDQPYSGFALAVVAAIVLDQFRTQNSI